MSPRFLTRRNISTTTTSNAGGSSCAAAPRELLNHYADVLMDFADACGVRLAELHMDNSICTTDRDFRFSAKMAGSRFLCWHRLNLEQRQHDLQSKDGKIVRTMARNWRWDLRKRITTGFSKPLDCFRRSASFKT